MCRHVSGGRIIIQILRVFLRENGWEERTFSLSSVMRVSTSFLKRPEIEGTERSCSVAEFERSLSGSERATPLPLSLSEALRGASALPSFTRGRLGEPFRWRRAGSRGRNSLDPKLLAPEAACFISKLNGCLNCLFRNAKDESTGFVRTA